MKILNKTLGIIFLFVILGIQTTWANPSLYVKLDSSPDASYNNVSISDVNNNDTLLDFKITAAIPPVTTGSYSISFPTGFEKVTSSSSVSDPACTGASVTSFTNTSFNFSVGSIGSFCVYEYILTYKVTSSTSAGSKIISIINTGTSSTTSSLTAGITTANTLTTAETVDSDSNGYIDQYKLTFSTGGLTNFSNTNLKVGTLTPTLSSTSSNIAYINFTDSTYTTGEKPQITDTDGGIFDGIGAISEVSISEQDKSEPIIMTINGTNIVGVANPSITVSENSKLTITFSENILSSSLTSSFTITEDSVDITNSNYITFNESNGNTMYYCLGGYDGSGNCNTEFDSAKSYSIDVGNNMTDLNSNTYSGGALNIDINVADSTPPVAGNITYNGETNNGLVINGISGNNSYTSTSNGSVNLSIKGTDNAGTVASMCISEDSALTNDNTCDTNWAAYNTTSTFTLTGSEGLKNLYIKFKDNAGNISSVSNDSIVRDKSKPSSSASPAGGYFSNSTFDVTLNCSDAISSCSIIYYTTDGSNPTTSSSSVTPGNTVSISGNNETKTLKFFAKDIVGNQEASTQTESYIFSNSYVTISNGVNLTSSSTLVLNGTCNNALGANDVEYSLNSGAYTAVDTDNCDASNTWSHSFSLTTNTLNTINMRLANNTSVTSSLSVTHDDTIPSSLSMIINNGDSYSNSLNVTLSISATDTSGLDDMCISTDSSLTNNSTCNSSSWETYSNSKSYTFTGDDGTKTLYIKFRDNAGNISSVINDSIIVETSTPSLSNSLASGTYTSSQTATFTTDGTNIYYTEDGTDPDNSSTLYTGPITYGTTTGSVTLKAISYGSSSVSSNISTYTYTFACNPSSVSNGSIAAYPTCTITCDAGYTVSGSSCVLSGGGGGGGGGTTYTVNDYDNIERLTETEEIIEEPLEDKLYKKYGILNIADLEGRQITGDNGMLELRANLKSESYLYFDKNTTALGTAETITAPYSILVNRNLKKKYLIINNTEIKSYNIEKLFFTGNNNNEISFDKNIELHFSINEEKIEGKINAYFSNDVDGNFSLFKEGLETNDNGDLIINSNKLGYFAFVTETDLAKYFNTETGTEIGKISNIETGKEAIEDLKSNIKNTKVKSIVTILEKNLEIPEIDYYLAFDKDLQNKYSEILNSLSDFASNLDNYIETKNSEDKQKILEAYQKFLEYKNLNNFEEKYVKKSEINGATIYKPNYENLSDTTNKLESVITDKLNKLLSSGTISQTQYNEAINGYNKFILNLTILKQYKYNDAKEPALAGVQELLKIYNLEIIETPIEDETPKVLIKDKYNFTKELKYGDYNSDVGNLQDIMKAYNYFDYSTTMYFGNITKEALINFSKEILGKENPEGILTQELIEKLNNIEYKE